MARQLDAQITARIPSGTRAKLDELAHSSGENPLSLVRRLIEEGVRREQHPGIGFRVGGSGLRRARIEGHRLDVWQVMETVWDSDGDVEAAAEFLNLRPHQVRAAVAYYADYPEEIDELSRRNREEAERQQAAWERQQAALRR